MSNLPATPVSSTDQPQPAPRYIVLWHEAMGLQIMSYPEPGHATRFFATLLWDGGWYEPHPDYPSALASFCAHAARENPEEPDSAPET